METTRYSESETTCAGPSLTGAVKEIAKFRLGKCAGPAAFHHRIKGDRVGMRRVRTGKHWIVLPHIYALNTTKKIMSLKKKLAIFSILLIATVYGGFAYSVHQLTNAGEKQEPVKRTYVHLSKVLRHLPFSSYMFDESRLDMIMAYHTLHEPQPDFILMMANGGLALKMYKGVYEKNRDRNRQYSQDALLEILGQMVRMPWDQQLEAIASGYASALRNLLSDRVISSEDIPLANELLALYFSRMDVTELANQHAAIADRLDKEELDPVLADAHIFLRKTRMSLARCIHGAPANAIWTEKHNSGQQRVVTRDYLHRQYYHAWDVALVTTVVMASKNESCHTLATNYQNLFGKN